jgi:hypothetical protein
MGGRREVAHHPTKRWWFSKTLFDIYSIIEELWYREADGALVMMVPNPRHGS